MAITALKDSELVPNHFLVAKASNSAGLLVEPRLRSKDLWRGYFIFLLCRAMTSLGQTTEDLTLRLAKREIISWES